MSLSWTVNPLYPTIPQLLPHYSKFSHPWQVFGPPFYPKGRKFNVDQWYFRTSHEWKPVRMRNLHRNWDLADCGVNGIMGCQSRLSMSTRTIDQKRRGSIVRPNAHDWKSCEGNTSAGSNPALSARTVRRHRLPNLWRLSFCWSLIETGPQKPRWEEVVNPVTGLHTVAGSVAWFAVWQLSMKITLTANGEPLFL